MENFSLIEFHKTRDFSQKVNATIEFIKQNIKSLGKSLLFITGPPILAAGLLQWSIFSDVNISSFANGGAEGMKALFFSPTFWVQVLVISMFFIVSSVTTIATINSYMILYEEKRTNKIETNAVWDRVRNSFWMYLSTMVLFWILMVAVYIVVVLFFLLLGLISPFLIFLGVLVVIPAFIYFFVCCTLMFIIRAYERIGFFESISRSFRLIQGKWWSTCGLSFILYLLAFVVSFLIGLPGSIISSVTSLHDFDITTLGQPDSSTGILGMIFFTLSYLMQSVIYSLPNIGIAFQYFNLLERKEAKGLMSQVEFIGSGVTSSAPSSEDEEY